MDVEWYKKGWGQTRALINSPFYSKHELKVLAGGYCSLHYHRSRANRFTIVSGMVDIVEMFGPFVKRTRLGPDNTHDVPSLVPHMFVVYKNGVMIEEYYADRGGIVQQDDIIRLIEGGKMAVSKLDGLPISLLQGTLGSICSKIK